MSTCTPAIPSFQLFGEQDSPDLAEMLHCETIATRSRPYLWEIAPHRHPALHQVLFVFQGEVELLLGNRRTAMQGPMLAHVPCGTVHGFRFSAGTEGIVITLAQEYPQLFTSHDPLHQWLCGALPALPDAVPCDAALSQRLERLGAELLVAQTGGAEFNQASLRRVLAEAWLRLALVVLGHSHMPPGNRSLIERFELLVQQHYTRRQGLDFYAAQLGCTARTLARVVQQRYGITPLELINRRIVTEARRLLRFTNAGCGEVAAELGFEDPSYFARFYKRMTGKRPSQEK